MLPGFLEARDRYFPGPTAHSQPPAVARYSVPLATTGEAQIRDPRLIRSRTSSILPAFNTQRYFAVGMYTLPSATSVEPHVCDWVSCIQKHLPVFASRQCSRPATSERYTRPSATDAVESVRSSPW